MSKQYTVGAHAHKQQTNKQTGGACTWCPRTSPPYSHRTRVWTACTTLGRLSAWTCLSVRAHRNVLSIHVSSSYVQSKPHLVPSNAHANGHTEAVNAERPDLIRSQHFYWTEIGATGKSTTGSSGDSGGGGKKKAVAADVASEVPAAAAAVSDGVTGTLTRARRIDATSAPPLRPWEKDRYSGT